MPYQGTNPATRELYRKYEQVMARLNAKAAELKDETPQADARRIESEHQVLCDEAQSIRERLLGDLVIEQESQGGPGIGSIGVGHDVHGGPGMSPMGRAISDALYSKMTGRAPEPHAREFMGQSLLQIGAGLLERRGMHVGWADKGRIAELMLETRDIGGAMGTDDFPQILTTASNRVMQDAYKQAASPLKLLCRPRTASDFRNISLLRLSEAPALLKVGQSGEVKYGSRAEAKEGFRVSTFARIMSVTRELIVNDDLNAWGDASGAFGRAAAETEANELVALLTANSGSGVSMDDAQPMFTTARGNKAASGTAITIDAMSDARKALRDAKGLDGTTPISATPKYIVVGSGRETQAEQLLATIYAAQYGDANPFSQRLSILVEPRLQGNSWWVFADPTEVANFTFAYLSRAEGPQFQVRQGWQVLGLEMRALLDWGCGPQDFRGGYLNPGA